MVATRLLVHAATTPVMPVAGELITAAIVSVPVVAGLLIRSARPAPMPTGRMHSAVMAAGTPGTVTTVASATVPAAVSTASFSRGGPTDHNQRHHDPAQNDCNPASHDSLPLLKKNLKTSATCPVLCAPRGGSSFAIAA